MNDLLLAFGRGFVKVLISLFIGTGIGLLTFGLSVWNRPDIWSLGGPPGEMFFGVGAGVLSAGLLMMAMFLLPRLRKVPPPATGKSIPPGEWSE